MWYDELKKDKKVPKVSEEELELITSKDNIEEEIVSNEEKMKFYKKIQ